MKVGRPKDLEKRKRILDAAKSLFLECGYDGCTMNSIAQKAEVTKLTVYNHFQDKATLFTAAIEDTCDHLINASPISLTPASNFRKALQHTCALSLDLANLPEALKMDYLLIKLASQQSPLALQFYNASHGKLNALWENFFEQAISLQFICRDQPQNATLLIVSLLTGLRHHEVLMGIRAVPNHLERQEIIDSSIDLFMHRYACKT